jgi:hypothetical protein
MLFVPQDAGCAVQVSPAFEGRAFELRASALKK